MEKPNKSRTYDAIKAEALRLASESCSTQAATRTLTINPKRLYKWQLDALPVEPTEAAEMHQLFAANKRLAQELEILKRPLPSSSRNRLREPLPVKTEEPEQREWPVFRDARAAARWLGGKLTTAKWAPMAHCPQDTVGRDIANLVAKGVLVHEGAGGRNTSYRLAPEAGRFR